MSSIHGRAGVFGGRIFWRFLAIAVAFGANAALCLGKGPTQDVALAWESAPRTNDPRYASDADSQYLENLIHCSLVTFGENGQTIPDLAKEWKWVDDKTLAVTINANGKFNDGSKVTAEDVKATYLFFKRTDISPPSPRAGAFSLLSSVEVKSPTELLFKLSEPDASFVTNLIVGILPVSIATQPAAATDKGLVGCGPFVQKSFDVSGVELVPNFHYELGAIPKISSLKIKIVKDETTRFAKLQKGELQIVQNILSRDKVSDISKSQPQLKVLRRQGLNTAYLGFNVKDPVLQSQKVRLAIAKAINREPIITHVLKGFARPALTMLLPEDPFFNKNLKQIAYNISESKKLLDEAGFKDPDGDGPKPRFTLTYKTTTNDTRILVAKAIGADLRKIGIQVMVQPLEWGKFKEDVDKGQVQLWSLNWVGFKDPDIYRFAFTTPNFPPAGANRGWFSNIELDKVLGDARLTTDLKKRKDLYLKAQELVQAELPYVFLWHEDIFAVTSKDLKGFKIFADGRFAALREAYRE